MIETVNQFIKQNHLIEEQTTVLVGVSGGPDSLALLHYLMHYQKSSIQKLVAVHVDHMFRGEQSEEDLLYVKEFCDENGILFEGIQIDVTSYKKEKQVSSQVAARECRYTFFAEMMEKHQADYLALAHHGDDQIETILMRLVRGSHGKGYAGMQVQRPFSCGSIIRPFLSISRKDIETYCMENELQPRMDPSNQTDDYTRNRFRHHVLPFLKAENPAVHERFQQFSKQIMEDSQLLDELTKAKMNKVIKEQKDDLIKINIKKLLSLPKSLQRRGIQLILNYLYKEIPTSLSAIHIDNLLALLESNHPSGELHFPKGLQIVRSYDLCSFTYLKESKRPFLFQIDEQGHYAIENGSELFSQKLNSYPKAVKGNDFFILDPDLVELPLFVRTRKRGDKMTLKGMNGSKKVKDIFIDNKIPLQLRETWPVVVDSSGMILWIPGLKKSSYEANSMSKTNYILLKYKQGKHD